MRTSLRESLINNLLYNERRQKDSVKFFEISDVYCVNDKNLVRQKTWHYCFRKNRNTTKNFTTN